MRVVFFVYVVVERYCCAVKTLLAYEQILPLAFIIGCSLPGI
jgi:hypothetical protein